jgi:hypothetical protein
MREAGHWQGEWMMQAGHNREMMQNLARGMAKKGVQGRTLHTKLWDGHWEEGSTIEEPCSHQARMTGISYQEWAVPASAQQ